MVEVTFKKYPDDLFEAQVINSATTSLEVDHNIKAVYLYMLLRYKFFSTTTDGVFYENQSEIGEKCGLSRRSVIRYVSKLSEIGLLEVKKKRLKNGAVSNSYVVHEVDGVRWWYDDNRKSPPPPKREAITPRWDKECPF